MTQNYITNIISPKLNGHTSREERKAQVAAYLARQTQNTIPEIGKKQGAERVRLFIDKAKATGASVNVIDNNETLVKAIRTYLRNSNLPSALRLGMDTELQALPFETFAPDITISHGASSGDDITTLSRAQSAIAETGSLVLTSGQDNPTTLTLLGTHHLVIVNEDTITANMETAFGTLKQPDTSLQASRHVAVVSGPSRSADIEQTLLMGAHGPKHLAIFLIKQS